MTLAEEELWQRLRGSQIQGLHFRRQQVIDGFITDFYCHEGGVVVEVDGEVHQLQLGHDKERDRIIAARGFAILRFTNDEVLKEPEKVVGRIAAECGARRTPSCAGTPETPSL
jgi:very-short-patch-repair endonuclease